MGKIFSNLTKKSLLIYIPILKEQIKSPSNKFQGGKIVDGFHKNFYGDEIISYWGRDEKC